MEPRVVRRLPAYVYLQELLRGRRVLELGCGEGQSAHFLLQAGAQKVVGMDTAPRVIELARSRYKAQNLELRAGDYAALELEDKSIDAVCVPAGADLLRRRPVLDEIKRVLAPGGVALFCVSSADRPDARGGLPYHEVVERLTAAYGGVRMVGVSPFVGFSMVEFGDEAAELTEIDLDTQLAQLDAPGGEAGVITDYVALVGSPDGAPRGYTVVQLPVGLGLPAVADAQGMPLFVKTDGAAAPAAPEAAPTTPVAQSASNNEAELRRRVARLGEERAQLNTELATLRARASEADVELGRMAAQSAIELAAVRADAAQARAQASEAQKQLSAIRKEALALRADLDAHQALGALGAPPVGDARETMDRGLEAQLAAARLEISDLRSARKNTFTAPPPDEIASLKAQLEETRRLAAEHAEKASAAETARREAVSALMSGGSAPAGGGDSPPGDSRLLWEAALRHEEELKAVRAELDERDAYIEELESNEAQARAELARLRAESGETQARLEAQLRDLTGLRTRLALAEGLALKHKLGNGAQAELGGGRAPVSLVTTSIPVVNVEAGAQKRLGELEAKLATQQTALEQATARWKQAESARDDVARKLSELERQQASEARARRDSAAGKSDDLSRKLAELEARLAAADRARVAAVRELEQAREQISNHWAEREQFKAAAEAQVEAIQQERDAKVSAARGELEILKAGWARRQRQIEQLTARVAELESRR